MQASLVIRSIVRQPRRMAWLVGGMTVGLTLLLSLLFLVLDVEDRVVQELRAFGSNLRVEPAPGAAAALQTSDLPVLKSFFWRNNVLAFNPRLEVHAEAERGPVRVLGVWFRHEVPTPEGTGFVTGARETYPFWNVTGAWPEGPDEALAGAALAQATGYAPGDTVHLRGPAGERAVRIAGVLSGDAAVRDALVVSLETAQALAARPGEADVVDVVARTNPEDELARAYNLDPAAITPEDYERWVCTAYPGSVAVSLEQALPGSKVRVVRRVSETQGAVLRRLSGLMQAITLFGALASMLGISAILGLSIRQRRRELALHRALGATTGSLVRLLLAESALVGALSGLMAAAAAVFLGPWLVAAVFGVAPEPHRVVWALGPLAGALLAWASVAAAIVQTLRAAPARMLSEEGT